MTASENDVPEEPTLLYRNSQGLRIQNSENDLNTNASIIRNSLSLNTAHFSVDSV